MGRNGKGSATYDQPCVLMLESCLWQELEELKQLLSAKQNELEEKQDQLEEKEDILKPTLNQNNVLM